MKLLSLYFETFFWEIASLVIVHVCTVILLFKRANRFVAYEDRPLLLSKSKLSSVQDIRQFPIKMGMYIEDFTEFDTARGFLTANISLWFRFNPRYVPLTKVKLFSFDKGKIDKDSQQDPIINSVGEELLVRYDLEVKLSPVLNQRAFPVESHKVFIVVDNKALSAEEFVFDVLPSNFSLQADVKTPEWKPIDHTVETGFMCEEIDRTDPKIVLAYPRAIFCIDFMRRGKRNAFILMLPMSLIFYLTLFSLVLDPFTDGQADLMKALIGLGVPGFVAYAFVLAVMVPRVSYFTLMDQVYILYLSATFVITFTQIIIIQTPSSWSIYITLLRKGLFILAEISVVLGVYLILLGPINQQPKEI